MPWTLPNILTLARLLAAPMVALIFVILPRGIADWAAVVIFAAASATDWLDGFLARRWNQTSRFGAMLDPIADKAMVVIALSLVVILTGLRAEVLIPVVVILFREVFVSGLREFLGDTAGTLKVTKLAKWKTTVQMIAIAILLAKGGFEGMMIERMVGMDEAMIADVLSGAQPDHSGFAWASRMWHLAHGAGLWLLWVAAALTAITGADYLRKAMPHLREDG